VPFFYRPAGDGAPEIVEYSSVSPDQSCFGVINEHSELLQADLVENFLDAINKLKICCDKLVMFF